MAQSKENFAISVGGYTSNGTAFDISNSVVLDINSEFDAAPDTEQNIRFNVNNQANPDAPVVSDSSKGGTGAKSITINGLVTSAPIKHRRFQEKKKQGFRVQKGASNFISVGNSSDLNFASNAGNDDSPFSIVLEFKADRRGAVQQLAHKENEYEVVVSTNNKLNVKLYDANESNYVQFTTTDVFLQDANLWQTLVVSYDGEQGDPGISVYSNGVQLAGTNSVNGSYGGMHTGQANLVVGGQAFQGEFSTISVLNQELVAQTVQVIWDAITVGFTRKKSTILSANPRSQLNRNLGNTASPTSYPTVSRTGYQKSMGNYKVGFDDTSAVDFARIATGSSVDKAGMPYGGVKFPTLLPSGSKYLNSSDLRYGITTPYQQPNIPAVSAIPRRSTVGDWIVREVYYPNGSHPNAYQPFKEYAVDVPSSSFYLTGTDPETVMPGFKNPLGDKTQIRVEMLPKKTAYVLQYDDVLANITSASWSGTRRTYANTGYDLPLSDRKYTGFLYYNFADQQWDEKGLQDPATQSSVRWDMTVQGDGCNVSVAAGHSDTRPYRIDKIVSGTNHMPRQFVPPSGEQFKLSTPDAVGNFAVGQTQHLAPSYRVGSPTAAHFAPMASMYHATASQCLQMSDYISHPFLLEKIVVNFDRIEAQRTWHNNFNTELDCITQSDYMVFLYRQEKSATRNSPAEQAQGFSVYDGKAPVSSSNRYLIASASMCFYNQEVLTRRLSAIGVTTASWVGDYSPAHNPAWSYDWAYPVKIDKVRPGVQSAETFYPTAGTRVLSFTGSVSLEMIPAVAPQTFSGRTYAVNSEYTMFSVGQFAGNAAFPDSTAGRANVDNYVLSKYRASRIGHWWPGGTAVRPFAGPDFVGRTFDNVSPPGLYAVYNGYGAAIDHGNSSGNGANNSAVAQMGSVLGTTAYTNGVYIHGTAEIEDMTFLGLRMPEPQNSDVVKLDHIRASAALPIEMADSRAQRPYGPRSSMDNIASGTSAHGIKHQGSTASPYLLLPTDQLVIGIESLQQLSGTMAGLFGEDTADNFITNDQNLRTRIKELMTNEVSYPSVTGSFLRIPSGSGITLTLYGSMIRDNEYHEPTEFHFGLNQNLDSVSVHEAVVGNTTPLNQYLIEPTHMHSGTTQAEAAAMTGSFLHAAALHPNQISDTRQFAHVYDPAPIKGTTVRRVGLSRPNRSDSDNDDFSYGTRNKHVPISRYSRHLDMSERIWDTVMPEAAQYYNRFSMAAANTDKGLNQAFTFTTSYPSGSVSVAKISCAGDAVQGATSYLGFCNTQAHPFPYYGNPMRVVEQTIHLEGEKGNGSNDRAITTTHPRTARLVTFGVGWNHRINNLRKSPRTLARVLDGFTDTAVSGAFGFKYGIAHTEPMYSEVKFRRDKFGQYRDMLEQRPYTAFYQAGIRIPGVSTPETRPVYVKFVDSDGNQIAGASTTTCQNLDNNCTSSVPYFENQAVSGLSFNAILLDVLLLADANTE